MSMPDESSPTPTPSGPPASRDQIALDLMKFIAVQTGYGKGGATAGYGAKSSRTAEEYAESLLELFDRCRKVVGG
jgi:hypothetical protein